MNGLIFSLSIAFTAFIVMVTFYVVVASFHDFPLSLNFLKKGGERTFSRSAELYWIFLALFSFVTFVVVYRISLEQVTTHFNVALVFLALIYFSKREHQ